MEIKGEKVILVPIKFKERNDFYNLATKSYGSWFWYDREIKKNKTKKAFFKSWKEDYFEGKFVDCVRFSILRNDFLK
jgi:hypothetical protein